MRMHIQNKSQPLFLIIMNNLNSWEELKASLKPGNRLKGVVIRHRPYGVFVKLLGIEFVGLVELPNFKDEDFVTYSDFPPMDSSVDVVVVAFRDKGQQISLSMKPSLLSQSNQFGVDN